MHELPFADQGRLEDPHLWERALKLELDLERFDSDRRDEAVAARVKRDFNSGVRAGVVTTPTAFCDGRMYAGQLDARRSLGSGRRSGRGRALVGLSCGLLRAEHPLEIAQRRAAPTQLLRSSRRSQRRVDQIQVAL